MYSYSTMTYAGRTVHIIKGKSDASEDVQISIMADRYDSSSPSKLASQFSDGYLESNGWTRIGVINGGIFFIQSPFVFAEGIEKVFWTVHENDDADFDGYMGIGHDGSSSNQPIIALQSELKANLGSYRGAITGAFGLLRNGSVSQGATGRGSYGSPSGRTIIGRKSDGEIYFIATAGTTGQSGLTGAQCLSLAQDLGLYDAVALDGGGSVSMLYQGSWKVSTNRPIKNAIGMFVKQKTTPDPDPDPPVIDVASGINSYVPMFENQWPHMIMSNGQLVPVIEIKVKRDGVLVPLLDLQKGGS